MHVGALAAELELQRASDVALADGAGEFLVAQHVVALHQAAARCVRRGFRQRDADDVVELGHRLAANVDREVERRELRHVGDRAFRLERGAADLAARFERIRIVRILEREHRSAAPFGARRQAVIDALRLEVHAVGVGRELALERDRAQRVVEFQARLVEREREDRDARAFALILLVRLEQPVLALLFVDLEVDDRALQMDLGQDHATDEERQQLDADFHRVGLEHVIFTRPVRICIAHLLGAKARMHPGPDRLEGALDAQLAAARVANRAGDRAFQGGETKGDEQRQRDQEREDDAAGPLECAHSVWIVYAGALFPSCNFETHSWHHSTAVSSGNTPLDASCL